MSKTVSRIAVTGGAGQIAYSLLFRIAAGELLGTDQPIALHILEIPSVLSQLEGVKMELLDCAFPLLKEVKITSDPLEAFNDIDIALLIGSKPRGPGMERGDLLLENGKIFIDQGKALNAAAKKEAKIFVVGNPCNTNCLIAMHHAPRLSPKNFYAMTRLDQNRASAFLAAKANVPVTEISHMTIWGNHSSTQVPDFIHAKIKNQHATTVIEDRKWLETTFVSLVRQRGAAIIQSRGKSSAASAAQALIDAVKDVLHPTKSGHWFSSGIISNGNPYGIEDGLIYSFPCHTSDHHSIQIIPNLDTHDFLDAHMKLSEKELIEERDLVKSLIK